MRSKRIRKAKLKRYAKMILAILLVTLFIGGSERVKQHTDKIIYSHQYVGVEQPKAPIISKEETNYINEREMLARLLYTEARGESIECQRAVVSVVLNRGSDVIATITAPGQFDLGNQLDDVKPLQTQYDVVDYVLTNGITIPSDVTYFRSEHYHTWATDYIQIDNMYFSR